MDKEQGKIVHFHTDKKFGFIQYRGNKQIFFHQRQFRAGRTSHTRSSKIITTPLIHTSTPMLNTNRLRAC